MLIQVTKRLKQNLRTRWKRIKRSAILKNDANTMNYGRTINNGRPAVDVEITIGTVGSLILEEGVVGIRHIPCPQKILQKCSAALEERVALAVLEEKDTLISSLPSLEGTVGKAAGSAVGLLQDVLVQVRTMKRKSK